MPFFFCYFAVMTKRLMKYQGGGLAKRSRFGGIARYAASRAVDMVPYGRAAMNVYRGGKQLYRAFRGGGGGGGGSSSKKQGASESNPARGVETGYASGHSAYTKVKSKRRMSRKSYKKKKRFEYKVRSAVQGETKFQNFFQNSILGPAVGIDSQTWFEIPVMTGSSYVAPGTRTDANNVLFTVSADVGDFTPAADIAVNAVWSRQTLAGQTVAGTNLAPTSIYANLGSMIVYGYELEYTFINVQAIPICLEIFELTCVKDFQPLAGSVPLGASTGIASGTASMLLAANANNVNREALVQASGAQSGASYVAVGATPFFFADFAAYWKVTKSHVHFLDAGQNYRTQKSYKFRPIKFNSLTSMLCKKGVSHAIIGRVCSITPGSSANYASALSNIAVGIAGLTHTFDCFYTKRYMVKPLDTGNYSLGMRNQIQ